MTIEIILGLAALAATLVAVISFSRMRAAISNYSALQNAQLNEQSKLSSLRQEVGMLKEEIAKKNRFLEEARESARKKLRKDAQKPEVGSDETSSSDAELQRLRHALKAMEAQVHSVKGESAKSADAEKMQLEEDYKRQVDDLKSQVKNLKAEMSQRNDAKKKAARLAGVVANLETQAPEIVSEFARLARKAEQHEKLHSLAQGKFQLAQERFAELQKRYFAVCRELALAVGRDASISDSEARESAEQLVEAADQEMRHDDEGPKPTAIVNDGQ